MTPLRKAAEAALEAMEDWIWGDGKAIVKQLDAYKALAKALEEPTVKESLPVERPWQWLTFGEIADACEAGLALRLYGDLDEELVLCASRQDVVDFVRSLEAKLKEKNG